MNIIQVTQGTQEWLEARAGVITGTRLKSVMSNRKDTRQNLICELIAEKIAPIPESYQSDAMERGKIGEDVVKELLGYEIEEVGMVKKDGCDWLAVSPDGLVKSEDGKYRKAVEIKTPESKAFVRYAIFDTGIPDEYKWQVVQYFLVMDEVETVDFVIFNPDIVDKRLRIIVRTVTRESMKEDITFAQASIASFRLEWKNAMKSLVNLTKGNDD